MEEQMEWVCSPLLIRGWEWADFSFSYLQGTFHREDALGRETQMLQTPKNPRCVWDAGVCCDELRWWKEHELGKTQIWIGFWLRHQLGHLEPLLYAFGPQLSPI